MSLQQLLDQAGNPARMLRSLPALHYKMPFEPEYTTWRDEQRAWKQTSVLYDQSHHMTDLYVKGPDVKRLFSDLAVNSFAGFGKDKAKQFVACNDDGYVISDAILFGFDDDEYVLVGTPVAPNWVQYHAETGDYDVSVVRDERAEANPKGRLTFRYQLNGPSTQKILEKATRGPLEHIRFFNMGRFEIAGTPVRALNHTMAGAPGRELTGLELVGPAEGARAVLDALLEAGAEFGLRQGGSISYVSTTLESGWIPSPIPAIYTDERLADYRKWLPAAGLEGFASIGGSFASDNIEDYYLTPWDLGYGRTVKFDHDFIGREALERRASQPHRRKVWLQWNPEDAARVFADSIYADPAARPMALNLPIASFTHFQFDQVRKDGRMIGLATYSGSTVNIGSLVSLAMIDEAEAVDGADVTLLWGQDPNSPKPNLEPHVQTEIRATISTAPLT
ncbi:glycine cleavage system protein T [Mycolicibacterium chlorophenolicum]|uniref:glycine cleavage system protein T n=1 Tax=Mycolicibacterium chlorophenolicum TaxID=37916 RepID=UPI00069D0146|nr:glycine cleavage system protein T [Mycolicibacterium chlorophenolicum]